jgi:cytochrome b involved in lipid metabolism
MWMVNKIFVWDVSRFNPGEHKDMTIHAYGDGYVSKKDCLCR